MTTSQQGSQTQFQYCNMSEQLEQIWDSSQAWIYYADKCKKTGSDSVVQMNFYPQSTLSSNVAQMPSNLLWKAQRPDRFSLEDSPLAVCLPNTAQNPAAHQIWLSAHHRAAGPELAGVSLPEEHTASHNALNVCQYIKGNANIPTFPFLLK